MGANTRQFAMFHVCMAGLQTKNTVYTYFKTQHVQKTGFTGITIKHNTEMMYFLDKKLKKQVHDF